MRADETATGEAGTSEEVDPSPDLVGRPAESVADLADIEAIRQLKHAYFRLLDSKQFEKLGRLFVEDATTSYESGKYAHHGRDEVVSFLSNSLGDRSIVHEHLGHHPEITLTSTTTAVGSWYLHDRVIVPGADFELGGTAIYTDRYEKVDGAWRIRHTGYVRVYEEQRKHSTGELTAFRDRFNPPSSEEPS
jgi:bile-acid 7alpha-dehydratase